MSTLSRRTRRRMLRVLYCEWARVKRAEGQLGATDCPLLATRARVCADALLHDIRAIEAES